MYNPLNRYPKVREYAYLFQWVVNLILLIIGIILTAMGLSPLWWVITQLVANGLWGYLGLTAQGNVTGTDAVGNRIERGAHEA
jgi:hypothetical protein